MTELAEELLPLVEASLDTMRPYLKDDGGNVEVVEITNEMVVKVRLLVACSTCPKSFMTMKAGIEEAVKRSVPQIKGVEAVNLVRE